MSRHPPHSFSQASHNWRGWWTAALFALLLAVGQAQPAQPKEYHIKAIFLFNFVQFVEWPDVAFADASTPISIGILGDDPFGPSLDEVIRDETVKGRPLTVVRARRLADLSSCQLIFVSKSESRRLEDVLSQLANRPVLTVSELDGFAQRGGVIAFFSEGKKVRFEINPSSAKRVQLKISSELLGLGKITGQNSAGGLD
jgi:hypothetical protein